MTIVSRDWHVVIPVKALRHAKTRFTLPPPLERTQLALALATDTISTVLRCVHARQVIVVSSDHTVLSHAKRLGASTIDEKTRLGINGAIKAAISLVTYEAKIAVIPADLPALTMTELGHALDLAESHPRAFVPDADNRGTVLLTATRRSLLQPQFGVASANEHARSGSTRITGDWPGLRRDIDTVDDLHTASRLGLGPATQLFWTDFQHATDGRMPAT